MESLQQIPFLADNVEKIVTEFYATSQVTNEFKPQLDQWLKQAQNSHDAWNFSWQLLDMNKPLECQFYGASTLYNKVSKYFVEVPDDQFDILKDKLLEKLILYATNSAANKQIRLIQRKLNSTLAKLALFLINNQWATCIRDIIQTIPNLDLSQAQSVLAGTGASSASDTNFNKNQLVSIVIDLLTLLPEEFASINLPKPRKSQINSELRKNFSLVFQFLFDLFNNQQVLGDMSLIENGVKCLTSWVEFGIGFNDVQQFIEFIFVTIYQESLFETSAEFLTCLFSSEESLKYSNSLFKYTPKVIELRNLLTKYIAAKDNDGCVVLTKLILSFAENQLRMIFDGLLMGDDHTKQIILQLLQFLLNLSSMPGNFPVDEESSDLTFVFWYSLQDSLLAMDSHGSELQSIFRPFFISLLEIFIVKLQLPDNYDEWSDEEKERLRCYRIDIGDTMVYMISVVGEIMLEFIIRRLTQAIEMQQEQLKSNPDAAKGNFWKVQEALIYMLQSVVSELNESCSPDFSYANDGYLVNFIDQLPRINYVNKHILSTTLLAVGSLGSWLERNQSVLPNAISLCLLGLKTESVTQSASFALKDIINDCDLSPYSDQILSICQECLKMGIVAQNYEVRIMSIIGLCLSDLLVADSQRAMQWLNMIVEPNLAKLTELAQITDSVDKQSQALTCHVLNLISQLMSSLIQRQKSNASMMASNSQTNGPNDSVSFDTSGLAQASNGAPGDSSVYDEKKIVNSLLIKLLPIYKRIVTRNLPTDLVIVDKLFESISVTLSSSLSNANPQLGNESIEPYLVDIIEMFYALNENFWRRYAYEVCRQILMIWWKNDKYKQLLENLFLYCNQNAMKLMLKDLNWFHDHTDVVEQYCTCLAKLLKSKYYDLFEKLNHEALTYLMRFVQLGLQLPEQYTLRAVATFLDEFIKFTKTKKHLVEFMEQNAAPILEIVLLDISGALPRHLVDILAGILHTFVKEYPQLTNVYLSNILVKNDFQPFSIPNANLPAPAPNQPPPTSNYKLTREQKLGFIKSCFGDSNNKRKFKELINEFSLTCRGLVNTQYARETTNKF